MMFSILLSFLPITLYLNDLPGTKFILPENPYMYTIKDRVMAPDGSFYFLVQTTSEIYHLDDKGVVKHKFGGQGEGPGEMNNPVLLQIHDETIYINHTGKVSAFTLNGSYIRSFPRDGWDEYYRIDDGWFFTRNTNGTIYLYFRGDDGKDQELMECGPSIADLGVEIKGSNVSYTYQLAENYVLYAISSKYFYVYATKDEKIYAFDLKTRKMDHVLKFPGKPIPFDLEWGKEEVLYQEQNTHLNGRKVGAKVKPVFPTYFPLVGKMFVNTNDELHVLSGLSAAHKKSAKSVLFDAKGVRLEPKRNYYQDHRVLKQKSGKVWVFCYDIEAEENFVQIVDIKDISKVCKKYPDFEPEIEHYYSIFGK